MTPSDPLAVTPIEKKNKEISRATTSLSPAVEPLTHAANGGEYIDCSWACSRCVKAGSVRPWRRATITVDEALKRHSLDTRSRCVGGCMYSVRSVGSAPVTTAEAERDREHHEAMMRQRVEEYLAYLNSDKSMGADEFATIKGRIITLACILFGYHGKQPISAASPSTRSAAQDQPSSVTPIDPAREHSEAADLLDGLAQLYRNDLSIEPSVVPNVAMCESLIRSLDLATDALRSPSAVSELRALREEIEPYRHDEFDGEWAVKLIDTRLRRLGAQE